jgi:hypothetical protein
VTFDPAKFLFLQESAKFSCPSISFTNSACNACQVEDSGHVSQHGFGSKKEHFGTQQKNGQRKLPLLSLSLPHSPPPLAKNHLPPSLMHLVSSTVPPPVIASYIPIGREDYNGNFGVWQEELHERRDVVVTMHHCCACPLSTLVGNSNFGVQFLGAVEFGIPVPMLEFQQCWSENFRKISLERNQEIRILMEFRNFFLYYMGNQKWIFGYSRVVGTYSDDVIFFSSDRKKKIPT